jgi:hypothetical protein
MNIIEIKENHPLRALHTSRAHSSSRAPFPVSFGGVSLSLRAVTLLHRTWRSDARAHLTAAILALGTIGHPWSKIHEVFYGND